MTNGAPTDEAAAARDSLQRASAARREGRLDEAAQIAQGLIDRQPAHPGALNLAGLIAQDRGAAAEAIALFHRATAADPAAPPLWLNLAAALRSAGDADGELAALEKALVLDPALLPALLLKAAALERLGRMDGSARAYRAVLATVTDEDALPAPLRTALAHGRSVVRADDEARAAEYAGILDNAFAAHEGEDLRRARLYTDALLGKRRLYQPQPTGPYFPFLPNFEFYDRALFPWFEALEAGTATIKHELAAIWAGGTPTFDPYVRFAPGVPVNQWAELDRSPRWGAYFLWKDGVRQEANCAACPATDALLQSLPMLDVPGLAPTAMFSILDAKTRIPAHTGVTNTRLTVHLPLVVPEGCGFRVGGETREWVEGEAWAFDDTIEHEAWNEGDRPRAILIIDAWNPFISVAERDIVRAAAGAMRL